MSFLLEMSCRMAHYRSLLLLPCVALVANAFTLVPFAPRTPMVGQRGLMLSGERVLLPLRMDAADADDNKAAAAEVADAAVEKEETPEEKLAREATEKAEAEAKVKTEAEAEAAKKKAEAEAARAEVEAARAAERKILAIQKAKTAVNTAGKEFGYIKEQFVVRWTEEAIVVGDGDWAALTEEVPDLCDNIGVVKALLEREDAKCVAMIKALDQLQVALTGERVIPASDLVPERVRVKDRKGLVAKSYAREKSLAKEAKLSARPLPLGATSWDGGRFW